jgi:hypothetical protein
MPDGLYRTSPELPKSNSNDRAIIILHAQAQAGSDIIMGSSIENVIISKRVGKWMQSTVNPPLMSYSTLAS